MTTHITLTTFVVFFALVVFGAVMFALAHFASHGAFSPDVEDDEVLAPDSDSARDDDESVAAQAAVQGQGGGDSDVL